MHEEPIADLEEVDMTERLYDIPRRTSRAAAVLASVAALVPASAGRLGAEEVDPAGFTPSEHARDVVRRVLDRAPSSRGLAAVVTRSPEVAVELAASSELLVHAWIPERRAVAEARALADKARLPLTRIVVERGVLEGLPHADRMVDLLVATGLRPGDLDSVEISEILRVLRPRGRAIIGGVPGLGRPRLESWCSGAPEGVASVGGAGDDVWALLVKPEPSGTDSWSHWEHGPDNNPVSTDTVIRAPYRTQWLGLPYYIAMPAISTVAGGRIFLAMGHIAHHRREEPFLNTLIAANGHNGIPLWKRKLPDGYLAHRSAFVATPEEFYMIDPGGGGCLVLDPETGQLQRRVAARGDSREWKWIALHDGVLYALSGEVNDPAETTVVRSSSTHWSWGELSGGYYAPRVPWGFGTKLLAFDASKGAVLWSHEEDGAVDSRALVLGGGRLYFYGPDTRVGCLDAKTGEAVWTNDDAALRRLIEERGRGLTSTPGFRSTCYALYTPKALFYAGQTRMNIVAVSLDDGHVLWSRKKTTSNPNMMYLDERLLVGVGRDGNTLALDPLTGETVADLGFRKRSCARLTATPDSLFCRGWREGLTRYDRRSGTVLFNGAFRPSCNDGIVPAGGFLYAGPWACDCNLTLMGRIALCSAGDFRPDRVEPEEVRLEVGGAGSEVNKSLDTSPKDWPAYRGNGAHSGSTRTAVAPTGDICWTFAPEMPCRPTAPTSAGDLVFVAGSDGKVRALGARGGRTRWVFQTAGPVLQPPTVEGGRAFVGSGDGFVYALEAATGRVLWRFRAAPVERRIMVYGALSSTWPVNTGVTVSDGVAYAAAGIIDYDGTYVYALDAATGRIHWQNTTSGHLDPALRKGVSAEGRLVVARGRLWLAGGNVISPASYDLETGAYVGPDTGDGSPRANRGEELGIFGGETLVLGGRLLYSARENVVNPGTFIAIDVSGGPRAGSVMPFATGKVPPAWDERNVVRLAGPGSVAACFATESVEQHLASGRRNAFPAPAWTAEWARGTDTVSLALCANAVVTVARVPRPRNLTPDWRVRVLAREDGRLLWERRLPGPGEPGGLAIDRSGRVVVCLADGRLVALGKRES